MNTRIQGMRASEDQPRKETLFVLSLVTLTDGFGQFQESRIRNKRERDSGLAVSVCMRSQKPGFGSDML